VQEKKADQAQVMIGFPGFRYTAAENSAVSVMNTIFGGSMSSRLFIQIRERRGLAYSISSGDEHFRDAGHAFVRMGVDPGKMNKALAVVIQEIRKFMEKGVSARELADAKTHIRGASALALEDSSAQANWYAKEALFYPAIQTPREKLADIERVTREDVQAVARQIFRMSEMRVAVIGEVRKEKISF
jgi:predicted Zn-dependent peptidase